MNSRIQNKINARKSTGPITPAGKQRSSMNALQHGLTGNRLILQQHEREAYQRLTAHLNRELQPQTELELQFVQKIIDCHMRLNRIAALDGNLLNIGLIHNESDAAHDDALESISAQCLSWIDNAETFEKLGRYEARISRQLMQYTKELERMMANRRQREQSDRREREDIATYELARRIADNRNAPDNHEPYAKAADPAPVTPESASFRQPVLADSPKPKSTPPGQRAA